MTSVDRRLAEIEAAARRVIPPPAEPLLQGLEWLAWISCGEVDELELVYRSWDLSGIEPDEDAARRVLAIEASALARQLSGWPTYDQDASRYTELDLGAEVARR